MENAVGAHLLNHGMVAEAFYWQEAHAEVDFVIARGRHVLALEVKTGRRSRSTGMEVFRKRHPGVRTLAVGTGGVPLEQFFESNPEVWL